MIFLRLTPKQSSVSVLLWDLDRMDFCPGPSAFQFLLAFIKKCTSAHFWSICGANESCPYLEPGAPTTPPDCALGSWDPGILKPTSTAWVSFFSVSFYMGKDLGCTDWHVHCLCVMAFAVWDRAWGGERSAGPDLGAGADFLHSAIAYHRTCRSLRILNLNLAFQVIMQVCLLR